jgi:hypothetical protein
LQSGRKADASLAPSLADYFTGIAFVESVDIQKPDPNTLRKAAERMDSSLNNLQGSMASGSEMLNHLPKGSEEVVSIRLKGMLGNAKALEKAISGVSTHLKAGKYPSMASCVAALAAIDSVMATYKVNARTHQEEGF